MDRRSFITSSARVIAGSCAISAPFVLTSRNRVTAAGKSIVAVSRSTSEFSSVTIRKMLERDISLITSETSISAGLRKIFKPGEKIGIKVNALAGRKLSSSPMLVNVLTEELIKAGIRADDIIVWDRTATEMRRAGFSINTGKGVKYIGTDILQRGGYNSGLQFSGEIGSLFSDIVRLCDAHINIPVVKDHDIAGISGALKNWYGAIHNPNKYHDDNCFPYVADLSGHEWIKNKQRLIIADASLVQPHGGPAYKAQWAEEYNGILASKDPVALDRVMLDIIRDARKKRGLESLRRAKRSPKYLELAEKYALGNYDMAKIKKVEIEI